VIAHYCTARAVAEAEASFVGPFEFMRVPLAALFGIVLFGQTPTFWLAAGSLLILAGIVILARGARGGAGAA
jgi:drug/metabolite transporter (DMT)-like permease